jgi:predicted ArsR family transcriptional regulator
MPGDIQDLPNANTGALSLSPASVSIEMDRLQAVGDPDLRDALLFARRAARAVTADELAEARNLHRNVARSRLERLVEAGLLAPGYERRTGRTGPGAGRPAKTYSVEPDSTAIEFPERRYESLLGLMLEALPAAGREQRLHGVGVAFGEELAHAARLQPTSSLRAACEAVCKAVGRLGFQASVVEATDDRAVIATPTCPLRPLVTREPAAGEIDRGMWSGLVARASGATVEHVECETHDCLVERGPCRIVVSLF